MPKILYGVGGGGTRTVGDLCLPRHCEVWLERSHNNNYTHMHWKFDERWLFCLAEKEWQLRTFKSRTPVLDSGDWRHLNLQDHNFFSNDFYICPASLL